MVLDHTDTKTLQVWPGGQSYTYQGDPEGPANQKRVRDGYKAGARWRKGTKQEWRAIRIELRAEIYGDRDIQGCDSGLVDELIKAANSGELRGDLAEGFGYEEIRGLYADPSDWDADRCREYANENGIDLPAIDGDDPDAETDDGPRGWLTEARDACQEYAQDNPAEVYEWWRVSSWLCNQLAAIGEVTIDNGYGQWWGRTCTGQGWIMDGTLQRIAASFERGAARR